MNSKQFIEATTKFHGDKYDYSKVDYKNLATKVVIICKIHKEFEQIPSNHLKYGCNKCGYMSQKFKSSKEDFVAKAVKVHGDKYDYSKAEYIKSSSKVIILCKEHGEFEQRPYSHLLGAGCKKCFENKRGKSNLHTTTQFIEDAKLTHGDRYDYSKVEYTNTKTNITIICKVHGEFEQLPGHHKRGSGCKKCAFEKNSLFLRSNTEEFISKAKLIHGDRYDYSKVDYTYAKTPVIIICKVHGEFEQGVGSHLAKNGCSKCSGSYAPTTSEWIEKAKLVHGERYDYSKVNYIKNSIKVIIICKEHGEFEQTPCNHLSGYNCKFCETRNYNYTTNEWVEKAKLVHGDMYDYSKVDYKTINTSVIIICKEHGEFNQYPSHHTNTKAGCPKCAIQKNGLNLRLDTERFISKAKLVHGDSYDYSDVVYEKFGIKVKINCNKKFGNGITHGIFYQDPATHLAGAGCSKCNNCEMCGLWRTYGGLCKYCKPANTNKLYQKTKEMTIVKYLKDNLPDRDFIHNKSVGKECTNGHFFPDIRFDCLWFQLIVEIDEHKHRGADYKCDEKRMYDITAKLGQPCVFIRYNPDDKQSDKNKLLKEVQKYIELQNIYLNEELDNESDINYYEKLDINNLSGFKVEYLFY